MHRFSFLGGLKKLAYLVCLILANPSYFVQSQAAVIAPSKLPAELAQATTAENGYSTLDLNLISPEGYDLLGYSYPAPFTRYEVFTSYTDWPYIMIGKLFFLRDVDCPGPDKCHCSASVAYGRGVWTAGHCVYNPRTKKWSRDIVFVPAYKNGSAPYGQWTPSRTATLKGWVQGAFSFDIGMVVLRDQGDRRIGDTVGWFGFTAKDNRNKHWNAFGYPESRTKNPFNGERLIVCQASYAYQDNSKVSPRPTGIGCDMVEGSSGGPWVVKFSAACCDCCYVNGVNSYGRGGKPKEMFSPYYGQGAVNLYNWAKSRS